MVVDRITSRNFKHLWRPLDLCNHREKGCEQTFPFTVKGISKKTKKGEFIIVDYGDMTASSEREMHTFNSKYTPTLCRLKFKTLDNCCSSFSRENNGNEMSLSWSLYKEVCLSSVCTSSTAERETEIRRMMQLTVLTSSCRNMWTEQLRVPAAAALLLSVRSANPGSTLRTEMMTQLHFWKTWW